MRCSMTIRVCHRSKARVVQPEIEALSPRCHTQLLQLANGHRKVRPGELTTHQQQDKCASCVPESCRTQKHACRELRAYHIRSTAHLGGRQIAWGVAAHILRAGQGARRSTFPKEDGRRPLTHGTLVTLLRTT